MLEQNLQSSAQSTTQSCSPTSVSEKDTHYPKQAFPKRGAGCTCQRGAPNVLCLFSLGHVSVLSPPLLSLVSTSILASAPQLCVPSLLFRPLAFHLALSLLLFSLSVVLDSCNPMDCSTPGFPVLHHLLEFAQIHVCWAGDAFPRMQQKVVAADTLPGPATEWNLYKANTSFSY